MVSQNSSPTSTSDGYSRLQFLDLWTTILLLHVNNSLEQLGHVGSWILKGREAQSLARLRTDAFAFELIYELLISQGKRINPLGLYFSAIIYHIVYKLFFLLLKEKIVECLNYGSLQLIA